MDLTQQVKNAIATAELTKPRKPFISEDKDVRAHMQALQQLSNGKPVPYGSTLRIVVHEGSRAPLQPAQKTSSHPGYIRNELGRFFTS